MTADDGITTKTYAVLFRYVLSIATLDTLYISEGTLEPGFDPEVISYTAWLPEGSTTIPDVFYETTDPFATVEIIQADYIGDTYSIRVTAGDGVHKMIYRIKFLVTGVYDFIQDTPNIYPNPVRDYINIDMKNNKIIKRIEILSIDGKVVRIIDHIHSESLTINRENLPSGMYFLRIHSDETFVKKVLIR